MKLVKALKVKNRLVGEVNRLQGILERENSKEKGSYSQVDVSVIDTQLSVTVGKLVAVKSAITVANIGIYNKICEMEELKNQKSFIMRLDTTHGTVKESGSGFASSDKLIVREYTAHLRQENVDERVIELQTQIETLQDEIDEYNATTNVDLEV